MRLARAITSLTLSVLAKLGGPTWSRLCIVRKTSCTTKVFSLSASCAHTRRNRTRKSSLRCGNARITSMHASCYCLTSFRAHFAKRLRNTMHNKWKEINKRHNDSTGLEHPGSDALPTAVDYSHRPLFLFCPLIYT